MPDLDTLEQRVLEQCKRMRAFIETLTEEKMASKFAYKNTRGEAFEQVHGPILDHVMNHGTHHRGQVSVLCCIFRAVAFVSASL